MKFNEIRTKVHTIPSGRFVNLDTCKTLKTKKAYSGKVVTKIGHSTVRVGVNYDNMKATIEGRANGSKPIENAGLQWGAWVDGEKNFFIQHKGNMYLRVANSPNKAVNHYFCDGKEITKEQAQEYCLTSEFRKGEAPEVMNYNIDNILSIG